MNKLSFLTPTVATVLEFFLDDPMKEHYVREVVREAKVSLGSANKILKMLTDQGLLTQESKGRMLIYRLNLKEPAVRQFKILVNILALKDLVDKVKNYSNKIVLFGSCSQGNDVKESDIDLMVITQEKEPARRAISKFNQTSQRKIAPITVSINEYVLLKKEDKPLYENIERGVTLWETE
ncbi:MAG: nucleotidyltransferase domain-containing protein [Candidatus Woesearchaeota archaeon]